MTGGVSGIGYSRIKFRPPQFQLSPVIYAKEFFKLNLVSGVVDIDANEPSLSIVVQNDTL